MQLRTGNSRQADQLSPTTRHERPGTRCQGSRVRPTLPFPNLGPRAARHDRGQSMLAEAVSWVLTTGPPCPLQPPHQQLGTIPLFPTEARTLHHTHTACHNCMKRRASRLCHAPLAPPTPRLPTLLTKLVFGLVCAHAAQAHLAGGVQQVAACARVVLALPHRMLQLAAHMLVLWG